MLLLKRVEVFRMPNSRFLIPNSTYKIFVAVFLMLLLSSNSIYAYTQEASTGAGCGDGVIQSGEECDGSNLAGQTCQSRGFSGGTLSCNANCTFNTSQCTSGGGGFYIPPILKPKPKLTVPTGDFNRNGLINFKDLSILFYWFGKTGSKIIPYDLNQDGKIDFKDVSILLYRWKE